MLLQLAWRNIWRFKGSTKITIILTLFSTVVLTTFFSLLAGTFDKQYEDTINLYPGYIQIKHPKFDDEPNYDHLLFDLKSIQEKLPSVKGISFSSVRLETFFLFASQENSSAGMLVGVQPSLEEKMSRLSHLLTKGRYLKDQDSNEIVIGSTLAKKLHLNVGSSLSIVGTDIDYSFTADNLTVVGIFNTAVEGYDANMAFINKKYLDTLVNTRNIASQIIIRPKNLDHALKVSNALRKAVGDKNIYISEWHEHMSSVVEALQLIKISRSILIFFFIAIIFVVVAIFAMLTLLSRTKEIGLMKAMGTTPKQVVGIILLERLLLAVISIAIGVVVAFVLIYYIHYHPISFVASDNYAHSIGFMELVFVTKISWVFFAKSVLIILSFSLVSILYPVWHLSGLKPLDAMQK